MKLLVTGCTGFIGAHLTRALLADGHEVIGLVRNPKNLDADLAERIEVLRGDLGLFRDEALVLPEVDVVVHLAAVIAGKDEAEYAAINFGAVQDILAALGRQTWRPKRFVFASSLAAAGPSGATTALTEDVPAAPIDAYGRAKRDAEALLRAQPFPTTAFRPPLVLGPGDPATLTLYKMARAPIAFVPAGAPQRLSFIAVEDLVRAIIAMSLDATSEHRLYYATFEQPITNHTLLRSIAGAVSPGRRFFLIPIPRFALWLAMKLATFASMLLRFKNQLDEKQYAQMTAPAFVCTSARLTADTGWMARVPLDDATEGAVRGYRERGLL